MRTFLYYHFLASLPKNKETSVQLGLILTSNQIQITLRHSYIFLLLFYQYMQKYYIFSIFFNLRSVFMEVCVILATFRRE